MSPPCDAAELVREARLRSGLSQRELAARADTSQSVVARIEGGQTSPGWDTLNALLAAAGFALSTTLAPAPVAQSHMLDDVSRILRLSPEDRLRELATAARFVASARSV